MGLDHSTTDAMSQIRFALRTLLRQPGPTLVVVMTLGVAIAATTVIYSVIDLVWHFIPAVNQERLVYAASTDTRVVQAEGGQRSVVLRSPASMPDLADWGARSSTFEQFAGFTVGSVSLTGVNVPLRLTAISVTANLPEVWGFAPALGRGFRTEEGQVGATPVTLLSYAFWQRQFSAKGDVLGQSLLLDAVPHTIVGVLPPEAETGFFKDADVFTPLVLDPLRGARDQRDVLVTGRLKRGVSREQAAADLDAIARQLQSEHPETNQRVGAVVLPLLEASGFNVRILISILGLIGLLVLVVACANVASVIVAQSMTRRHELAVRAALGASRADRIRQLMMESMLISIPGGMSGILLAAWGLAGLRWLAGDAFGFAEIHMSGRVLAAGLLTAFAAPLGFGLLPALRLAAPDPQELRDGTRAAGATIRGRRTRNVIVALQTAAAIALMLQIALFIRTTWKLSDIAPGFDAERVLTFRIGLPTSRYQQPGAIDRFTANLLGRLRALPGVASIGVIDRLPVADRESTARLTLEGAAPQPLEARPLVARSAIAGDFMETMRVPVSRGRTISNAEMTDASPVALVSEEAARRFWPGRNPLGTRIALDAAQGQESWLEVVGVVGNLRNSDVDQGPQPHVFVPTSRMPTNELALVVKSVGPDPLQLVPAIRAQVAMIDPNQPIYDIATMSKVLFDDLAGTYVLTAILTTVGLVALCLSAAGIYGLVAHSVAQRRREIGVRMALGARPARIVRMIVGHTTRPVAIGGLVGLVGAILLSLGLATAVPELDPRDPITYVAMILTIVAVASAASVLPARRAASISPVEALRAE